MKGRTFSFLRLLALVLATLLASGTVLGAANEEAAIRSAVDGFEDTWNRHDMNAFAKLFSEDADFVNVAGVRWIGRQAILEEHAARHVTTFRSSHLTMKETTVKFLTPDVAVARSLWELVGQTDHGGAVLPTRRGIVTNVLVKKAGKWLIAVAQNTNTVQ